MKTKTKKTNKAILITSALLLFMAWVFLMGIRSYAKEPFQYQYYNDKYYETDEEKEELEKILRADGYICVSSWCTDDEEATEYLKTYELFYLADELERPNTKNFVSPVRLKSMLQGGFDNLDTVMIDYYSATEEAKNLEGKIARNYTNDPIPAGSESTGLLTIESIVNQEILTKYAYTKAYLIFTSIDTGKDYQIDLNAANSFNAVVTVADGNYTVKSMFLGDDCVPSYDITTFTIAGDAGVNATLTFDFTANWVGTDEKGNAEETSEITTLQPTDTENIIGPDVEIKTNNWIPVLVTCLSLGFIAVVIVVVILIFKKKTRNTSM